MLRELEEAGAVSRETGLAAGSGHKVLPALQKLGLVNRGRDRHENEIFWVRQAGEPLVGASTARGWIVILNKNVQAPSGKSENLFLARSASYDGSSATFRKLLRNWLDRLGLRWRDVNTYAPIEELEYDAPIFENKGQHVFFDE